MRHSRRFLLLVCCSLWSVLAAGCLHPLPAPLDDEAVTGCVNDVQCKGDRICEQGVCVGTALPFAVVSGTEAHIIDAETSRIGCEDGNPQACYEAGMRSVFGVDGPEDLGQARAYFHRACRAGHVYACMNLGLLLDTKPGAATDPRKCRVFAVDAYDKACEQGHAEACHNAARLYEGLPLYTIPQDRDRSQKLFKRACDLGYKDACKLVKQ